VWCKFPRCNAGDAQGSRLCTAATASPALARIPQNSVPLAHQLFASANNLPARTLAGTVVMVRCVESVFRWLPWPTPAHHPIFAPRLHPGWRSGTYTLRAVSCSLASANTRTPPVSAQTSFRQAQFASHSPGVRLVSASPARGHHRVPTAQAPLIAVVLSSDRPYYRTISTSLLLCGFGRRALLLGCALLPSPFFLCCFFVDDSRAAIPHLRPGLSSDHTGVSCSSCFPDFAPNRTIHSSAYS